MPIYEYVCRECGDEFEELLRALDDEVSCPRCESADCERKFSVFGFSSGAGFVSSAGSHGCSGCSPSPAKCKGCR
ncbi:MAG: zinc ribbon domain-containing protein [candidate division Zixibacteria bacterium]|nr:zinc ribbon domain-containing protein [candidate division Zixibacteria bacterium]NIR65823.1 zinc ribbon domain-containing protein [candidate division Zixibacteria bacterium]NIS16420.1 zinc ribbon domain-containing protein [candidate division Zixibacteria bacterium]NIS47484.1 zinc ribbon domain-containing protein [candidate division Zixibacteria bacterium]NIT52777.1 zinc ribbon domain-containing protein [candidate division Zixibacteria bacterium]